MVISLRDYKMYAKLIIGSSAPLTDPLTKVLFDASSANLMKIQICFLQQRLRTNQIKHKCEVLHPELESALLEWFLEHEREGPTSGELLPEQARKLYALMYPSYVVSQLKLSRKAWD